MGKILNGLKQSSQSSAQYLNETDAMHFTPHSALIIFAVFLLTSIGVHVADGATDWNGVRAIMMMMSSHPDDKVYQQSVTIIAWVALAVFMSLTYLMIFRMGSHYRTHFIRVTHSSLGTNKVEFPKAYDLLSWFFKEVFHAFPMVVAIASIATTYMWLWNIEAPRADMFWLSFLGDAVAGIAVYATGPVLFLASFHVWEYRKHIGRIEDYHDSQYERIVPSSAQSSRSLPAPATQASALTAPTQQRGLPAPKAQTKQQVPAQTSNKTRTPTMSQAAFVSKHPAGQLRPTSTPNAKAFWPPQHAVDDNEYEDEPITN